MQGPPLSVSHWSRVLVHAAHVPTADEVANFLDARVTACLQSFGDIYLGTNIQTGEEVAIKLVSGDHAGRPAACVI